MVRIALLGEYNPESETHVATDRAIIHSSAQLGIKYSGEWVSSAQISEQILMEYQGLWVAPGAPHKAMENTLSAIHFAREMRIPTFGTCGGFQLMILELARNLLGIRNASHAEYSTGGSNEIITPLSCSLRGKDLEIKIVPDSQVGRLYGSSQVVESFYCSFGINPGFRAQFISAPISIVGCDAEGDVRIVELPEHPFFVATLFVPQVQSCPERPHPLVTGFLAACEHRMRQA